MTERVSRAQRREQTRARLLDAAERLVAERGVAGASLDEIAAAAGVTKGAIYANFRGKDDLLIALLTRQIFEPKADDETMRLLADPALSERERYERLGEIYEKLLPRRRQFGLFFVEMWLYAMRNEAARARFVEVLRRIRTAGLRPVAPSSALADLPADQRESLVLALDMGLAMQHFLDPAGTPGSLYGLGMLQLIGDVPCAHEAEGYGAS